MSNKKSNDLEHKKCTLLLEQQPPHRPYHNHENASFLSLLLNETEKQILLFSDQFLTQHEQRPLDVLIHDGGLLRRQSNEVDVPSQLLCNLNSAIREHFGFKFVRFQPKAFGQTALRDQIHACSPLYLEFDYSKWKHYLEEHRDLCYMTNDKSHLLADNKQTIVYKSFADLKLATAEYTVYLDTVPLHHRGNTFSDLLMTDIAETQMMVSEGEKESATTKSTSGHKKPTVSLRKSSPFIEVWIRDPFRRMFQGTYFSEKTAQRDNHVTHQTPLKHSKTFTPNYRYIFQGWELLLLPSSPQASHLPFLRFLQHLTPNKTSYDYVLNWVAHLFQYPDTRVCGTCLCFLSGLQGSGKSTFLEFLLDLLGRYGKKINNAEEELFKNFTHVMEHYLLLAIDDGKSKTLKENYEPFKNLVTSNDARIRELYSPDRNIITNVRFLLISNNFDMLKLEKDSRRFAIFEPSEELVRDYEYFTELKQNYWDSRGNRKATLEYFLNQHKIPRDWHPEKSYPGSTLKKHMEASNLEPAAHYLYSLAKTVYDEEVLKQSESNRHHFFDVQSTELRTKLSQWFHMSGNYPNTRGSKIPNQNQLPSELARLGVVNIRTLPPGPDKISYQSGQWYRIPIVQFAKEAEEYFLDILSPQFCVLGNRVRSKVSTNSHHLPNFKSQLSNNFPLSKQSKIISKGENLKRKKHKKTIMLQSSQDVSEDSVSSSEFFNIVSNKEVPDEQKKKQIKFNRNEYQTVCEFFARDDGKKLLMKLVSEECSKRLQHLTIQTGPTINVVNNNFSVNNGDAKNEQVKKKPSSPTLPLSFGVTLGKTVIPVHSEMPLNSNK